MALNATQLEQTVTANLQAAGFSFGGEHAKSQVFVHALCKAVVEHIQSNAEVPVASGSSAGTYKVT